jgi:hypothetical protein
MRDPVRRGSEQHVAEEMAMVRDDDQIVPVRSGVVNDRVRRVPRDEIDADLDAARVCLALGLGLGQDSREELVLLALDLIDLAQRRSIGGQPALDRSRCSRRPPATSSAR